MRLLMWTKDVHKSEIMRAHNQSCE